MIPSDIRLYTWLDVEEVLLRLHKQDNWPSWLVWARAYWDGLTLGIRPGKQAQADVWLRETFDPRFSPDKQAIILESTHEQPRLLGVALEETEEEPFRPSFVPSLGRPGLLWPPPAPSSSPPMFLGDLPPVVALHSFKGGVGRTLHALALAKALTGATGHDRVLLVDGDFEAPGISWLLRERLPTPAIAFADVLALAHGDRDPSAADTVKLVAERLQHMLLDGILVLPSCRSLEHFTSLEIRPEHLMQGAEDPFIITRLLADIGKAVDARAVLVDLRAGLSELATGLLLDPRVYRVLVTTLSGQAVDGTCKLLALLGALAPSRREEEPLPALIITQIPEDPRRSELVLEVEQRLLEAARPFLGDDNVDLPNVDFPRVVTAFDPSLLTLPWAWEEVITRLQRIGMVEAMRTLTDWLPTQPVDRVARHTVSQPLRTQRTALGKMADRLEYAERGEGDAFLVTVALRRLALDHRRQVPIAVVIGAKGAGKTYTFLQAIQRQNWQTFVQDAGVGDIQIEAGICPMFESTNLTDSARARVQEVRQAAARVGGFTDPWDTIRLRDSIRDGLQLSLHEGQWRERWLDVIAWGVGCAPGQAGAGRELVGKLTAATTRLVMVVDGLEDLFQHFATEEGEQIALRALLQEVPEWLGQQPGRPLGILVFVRRDMVVGAVRQNAAQLMARYEPYALKWSREEVLRLVAWVALKAGILANLSVETLQDMEDRELVEALVPLWGRKLGSDPSREGRSAEWVIAALSDLRGQIQARDLIRFVRLAAESSVDDTRWPDRILVPSAMRSVLPECSRKKIDEIETENAALKEVFTKLRNLPSEKRQIPFTREDINLQSDEIKTLEDNGVVLREGDEYYIPEIFRLGLGFERASGARPRLLALARRAALRG